jgi:Tfp pilus assembly protein PilF
MVRSTAATARGPWLWAPGVDLLVGCGGWSLPLLALTGWASGAEGLDLAFAFSLLTLVCNHPHYAATIRRALSSPERRAAYRRYTVHLPLALAAVAGALVAWPALIPAVFTLYLVWSPWHYTSQNFGLVLLLARRAGAAPERRLLRIAFAASYGVWLLSVQSVPTSDPYVWSLALPPALVDPAALVLALVSLGAGSLALGRMGDGAGWRAIGAPVVLLSSQTLWFIAPWVLQVAGGRALSPLYYSTGALAFMHCAQYLWLTSWVERRETGAAAWRASRSAAGLVLGGIALFTVAPWAASALAGADLRESMLIVIALVNLHHFVLDGAVWRLRDPATAAVLLAPVPPPPCAAPPRAPRPALAGALAGALLALAGVNAAQQYLTREGADPARLALAQRLDPHDSRVAVRRAEWLAQHAQGEAAMQALAPLLDLQARNAAALRLYGSLLVAAGRYDDALAHLRRVRAHVGLDAPGLVNAGVLLARAGAADDAEAALRDAVRLDPRLSAAHLNLAGLCLQRGDGRCALAHYAAYLRAPDAVRDRDFAVATLNAAGAARLADQPALAAALLHDAATLAGELGDDELIQLAQQQLAATRERRD